MLENVPTYRVSPFSSFIRKVLVNHLPTEEIRKNVAKGCSRSRAETNQEKGHREGKEEPRQNRQEN